MRKLLTVVFLIALVYTLALLTKGRAPKGFTASCKFKRKSESFIGSTPGDGTDLVYKHYARIKSLLQYDLKGRPTLEQLIKDVDELHHDLPVADDNTLTEAGRIMYEKRIEGLRRAIEVKEEIGSKSIDLISVRVTMEDGHLAANVANTLVNSYLKKVRSELDESLIMQKKFFALEVARYRRQISEIGTATLRFKASKFPAGHNVERLMEDPVQIFHDISKGSPAKVRQTDLALKIKYLKGIYKDKPLGDRSAIQLAEWQAEHEQLATRIPMEELVLEQLKDVTRNWFDLHNEWTRMKRDLEEATAQLKIWDKRLRAVQLALTMEISERGMRLSVVQQAIGPPTSQKQPKQTGKANKPEQIAPDQPKLLMDGVNRN